MFKSQNLDNMPCGFGTGVPIWTGLQVLALWAFANGYTLFPWVNFADHPIWLVLLCLVVPVIHVFHFYCFDALIHTPFLHKHVHSVHHNTVNPSPWSSLSMHPVEHLARYAAKKT